MNTGNSAIYLDYNATTPIKPAVIDAMTHAMHCHGNPSSVHSFGREARKLVEKARDQIAAFANCQSTNIIFTGGATEANNTILRGLPNVKTIYVWASDHPSTLKVVDEKNELKIIPLLNNGLIDLDYLKQKTAKETEPFLVCVHAVNSETGVIQPIKDIAALTHMNGGMLHCDAVQAAGRIKIDYLDWGCDFMSVSAHKMGGPQGVGAIIAGDLRPFTPFIKGGGQEKRRRAGTENVADIVGLGLAAELAEQEREDYNARLLPLREKIENHLTGLNIGTMIAGTSADGDAPRVSNTVNAITPGLKAETQLMFLDINGVAVSSGSACSSGSFKASHVLTAMGYSEDDCHCSIRISMGWNTKESDIERFLSVFDNMVSINIKKQA